MKNTTSLCALGLLLAATLGGCEAFKPENRVRLGMTPAEVQALVGPPDHEFWSYGSRDDNPPNEVIEIEFYKGRASVFNWSREDESGQFSYRVFAYDGRYLGQDYKRDPNGRAGPPPSPLLPSEMPVLRGDPPAKIVKLYGVPRAIQAWYRGPLHGSFENGKLAEWETTPMPPIP